MNSENKIRLKEAIQKAAKRIEAYASLPEREGPIQMGEVFQIPPALFTSGNEVPRVTEPLYLMTLFRQTIWNGREHEMNTQSGWLVVPVDPDLTYLRGTADVLVEEGLLGLAEQVVLRSDCFDWIAEVKLKQKAVRRFKTPIDKRSLDLAQHITNTTTRIAISEDSTVEDDPTYQRHQESLYRKVYRFCE